MQNKGKIVLALLIASCTAAVIAVPVAKEHVSRTARAHKPSKHMDRIVIAVQKENGTVQFSRVQSAQVEGHLRVTLAEADVRSADVLYEEHRK